MTYNRTTSWAFLFFFYLIIFMFSLFAENPSCPELTGRVIRPNDLQYDEARLVSNYYTSKNKFPDTIVYCHTATDVQNAVKWAICKKIPIRVRSGGHNHEGFSTGSGLVIDVSEMKKIQLAPSNDSVTVEPGITGGELYAQLFKKGLTQVGGTCKDVGISGLVLTGGIGPLLRKHGLTCDTLISFNMVLANGEMVYVTKDNQYKDLFWACCGGGGGNFGIVTSLVLHVFPAKQVTWFNIGWDWEQNFETVINKWQELFSNGDKKWFSHIDIWSKAFPAEKFKKQPLKVFGIYYGSPKDAKKDLAPLLKIGPPKDKVIERVDWDKAIRLFEESTSVYITDKPEYKSTGAFAMHPIPKEGIKILVNTLRNSSSPLLNVLFFSMGGAIENKSPTETAYFYRKAKFFVVYSTQWMEEDEAVKLTAEVDALRRKLILYTRGDYVGNPDRNLKDYLRDYYGDNVQKLREVKRKYDPNNVFRFEQGIPAS